MIDLWPDGIEHTSLKAPVTILKEQGVLLGRKTGNIVEGEVSTTSTISVANGFEFAFYLYGPALGYRYRLLTISYSADLYPLIIRIDKTLYKELSDETMIAMIDVIEDRSGIGLITPSEDGFMEILKGIFATEKVRKVIGAIIAQSGVAAEPE